MLVESTVKNYKTINLYYALEATTMQNSLALILHAVA